MKKLMILAAVFLEATVMLTACGGSTAEYSEQTIGEESETEMEETEAKPEETMEAYKAECQDFDYQEYFRYEQEHLGEKIKLEMQVDQVIDGDFRGYDVQGNEYYIFDEREEESPFRVMEGDMLTVYGEYSGVVELTRAIGDYESEVFSITARYADLMEEEAAEEIPTESETMTEQIEADNPYQDSILLWKSYYVALTDADCMGLSKEELRIARNEIYDAYGRMFTSQDLIDYFNSKPWYQGTIPSDQFDDSVLTEIQKANIRTIQSYEELADEGSDYSVRGLTINDEYAIPQIPGEYTYVNNSDESQYVTLTIGSDVSLTFYGATGYAQELSGFSNINDQEYSNNEAGVSLIFNNYGQEMVYIMSDGTQITYTFSY